MIRLATKAAHESTFRRARVGAVICKSGRVLSTGFNRIGYSRFTLGRKWQTSIHAEAQAILELLKRKRLNDLCGATIYVSRIDAKGRAACSKPCLNCQRLITSVGISKVVYTSGSTTTENYRT